GDLPRDSAPVQRERGVRPPRGARHRAWESEEISDRRRIVGGEWIGYPSEGSPYGVERPNDSTRSTASARGRGGRPRVFRPFVLRRAARSFSDLHRDGLWGSVRVEHLAWQYLRLPVSSGEEPIGWPPHGPEFRGVEIVA